MKSLPVTSIAFRILLFASLTGGAFADAGEKEAGEDWALRPLAEVSPPAKAEGNPIDAFIVEKLAVANLKLSAEADRRTLIRRLSFDLHGLPPTSEEVEAFAADPDPQAYEKLVDKLLVSPHYGERFARHWLDIAHYADTHGFERDMRRNNAWPYRDYVIRSFNEDKPYNRFLQEQIAGDVLWPKDEQAVIATGFLSAGPWDYVGQVETQSASLRKAARSLDIDDMAAQVMTSTMAMTVHCARCHDHKLDPISQLEYYQIQAVFTGVQRGERGVESATKDGLLTNRANIVSTIANLSKTLNLADIVGGGDGTGNGTFRQGIDPRTGKVESADFGFLERVRPNHFVPVEVSAIIDGVFTPSSGEGRAAIPLSSSGITLTGITGAGGNAWDIPRNGPVHSQHSPELDGVNFSRGHDSLIGLHANAGITFDLEAARGVIGEKHLQFSTRVGYFGKAEDRYFADARILVDGKIVAEFFKLKRSDGLRAISIPLPIGTRFLTLLATDGGNDISMDQIGFDSPTLGRALDTMTSEEREALDVLREKKSSVDAELKALSGSKIYSVIPISPVPEIRVLRRGEPSAEIGDPVSPGALGAISMLDPDLGDVSSSEGERRAALAAWITHRDNPLTGRVIVNRLWHWHFGQGIVSTPSDFGAGGGLPSHPELLDWLAAELSRQGGSLKAMHRLILTSATYRQQSRGLADAPGWASDADNRLLWRQNPRRAEAEAVRDAVLAVSGKLNIARGGPGFEDFAYTEAYAPIYTTVTADRPELWRRSIYRYVVRTTPNRFLSTLDCPNPAMLTAKRNTTTTPLQSLALYNNDFMLRQARYFAQRLAADAGEDSAAQVRRGFSLAFGRPASPQEVELGARFIAEEGLFSFCRSLFNANEFVYVD